MWHFVRLFWVYVNFCHCLVEPLCVILLVFLHSTYMLLSFYILFTVPMYVSMCATNKKFLSFCLYVWPVQSFFLFLIFFTQIRMCIKMKFSFIKVIRSYGKELFRCCWYIKLKVIVNDFIVFQV